MFRPKTKTPGNSSCYFFSTPENSISSNPLPHVCFFSGRAHLKNISGWLKANKLYLNIKKTELIILHPNTKKLGHPLKFELLLGHVKLIFFYT